MMKSLRQMESRSLSLQIALWSSFPPFRTRRLEVRFSAKRLPCGSSSRNTLAYAPSPRAQIRLRFHGLMLNASGHVSSVEEDLPLMYSSRVEFGSVMIVRC